MVLVTVEKQPKEVDRRAAEARAEALGRELTELREQATCGEGERDGLREALRIAGAAVAAMHQRALRAFRGRP